MPGTGRISYTYSLSPYILPHFGEVLLMATSAMTYSSVNYDDGASDSQRAYRSSMQVWSVAVSGGHFPGLEVTTIKSTAAGFGQLR